MTARRLKLLLIPIFIIIAIGGAVFAAEAERTPEWQTVLEQYAAGRNLAVIEAVRARRPYNFTGELDYPIVLPGQFEYTADITYARSHVYQIALPYPPEEIHCVLVEQRGKHTLLLVNYYSDGLWRNGWVIHQGSQMATDASMQIMDKLGCHFATDSNI